MGIAKNILVLGCLPLACMSSHKDSQALVTEYRKSAETVSSDRGYTISSMAVTPEYLALARSGSDSSSRGAYEDLKKKYQGANYVALSISTYPDPDKPGIKRDVAEEELFKGRSAFAERLSVLQNQMVEYCYLELSDGSEVPPVSYSFDRGWGLRSDVNFLFAFPENWNGKPIELRTSRFVMKDFGLNTGTIRHQIKKPPRISPKG